MTNACNPHGHRFLGASLALLCTLFAQSAAGHQRAAGMDLDAALAQMERLLEVEQRAQRMPSLTVAIVHAGEQVYAHSFGFADLAAQRVATPATRYRIGSLTKPLTATLVMALVEDGLLDLDEPVRSYLPHLELRPSPHWAGTVEPVAVTLRQLLTHTAGVPAAPPNLVANGRDPFGGISSEALDAALEDVILEWPPGIYYSYSNYAFGIVGRVVEAVTGRSFDEVLTERLLEPLGMRATSLELPHSRDRAVGYRTADPELAEQRWELGALAPSAGVYASAEDIARFLALYLDGFETDAAPLSRVGLQKLLDRQHEVPAHDFALALGWFHKRVPPGFDVYWHTGSLDGHFAYIALIPEQRIGVVALTNRRRDFDPLGPWLARRAVAIFGQPESE